MQGAPFSLQLVQSSPLRGLRGLKLFPTSTAQSEQVRPLYCLANSWIFALCSLDLCPETIPLPSVAPWPGARLSDLEEVTLSPSQALQLGWMGAGMDGS